MDEYDERSRNFVNVDDWKSVKRMMEQTERFDYREEHSSERDVTEHVFEESGFMARIGEDGVINHLSKPEVCTAAVHWFANVALPESDDVDLDFTDEVYEWAAGGYRKSRPEIVTDGGIRGENYQGRMANVDHEGPLSEESYLQGFE